MSNAKNILMIYIEPTPYILGLLDILKKKWPGKIDVLFLSENMTQNWNLQSDQYKTLPKNKFRKYFETFKQLKNYDFIHLAGWAQTYLKFCMLIGKLKKRFISIESDTPVPRHAKLWKKILKHITYPVMFSLVDIFMPGGTSQAKYFIYYGVKDKRIYPVNMTVDITKIQQYAATLTAENRSIIRQHYGMPISNTVFLYLGRLEEYKGVKDIIVAFNQVKNDSASLLIVGDGSLREFVLKHAAKNKNIHYAGSMYGNALTEIYHSVDVLILPSHSESWGLVINEAMAMKLPVIVSDRVGCIDDLVIHDETGLIYEAENIAELTNKIECLAQSTELRNKMSQQAAIKIADWTLENEAIKMCQAWNKIINEC